MRNKIENQIPKSEIDQIINDSIRSSDDLKILSLEIRGERYTWNFPEIKDLISKAITLQIQAGIRPNQNKMLKEENERMKEIIRELEKRSENR
jgi:hypothetical protein